ncbi:hypothetical protein RIF29_29269 [Crotalaria pallida]|uniref:Uncharacterized protein n=1 Tax=Crotalaria pallida TaxID=3830 RepID=A0AAN9EEI0_CROPI
MRIAIHQPLPLQDRTAAEVRRSSPSCASLPLASGLFIFPLALAATVLSHWPWSKLLLPPQPRLRRAPYVSMLVQIEPRLLETIDCLGATVDAAYGYLSILDCPLVVQKQKLVLRFLVSVWSHSSRLNVALRLTLLQLKQKPMSDIFLMVQFILGLLYDNHVTKFSNYLRSMDASIME